MTGKIASLPPEIQDQLNHRLEQRQKGKSILAWLNRLPEVKAILKASFDGLPVNPQNLSEHKRRGFLDWQARQQALEFAACLNADDSALQGILPSDLADKLCRWVALRYAAATREFTASKPDLDKELRHLRNFCLLMLSLRRGEVNAARLELEKQRVNLLLGDTTAAKEIEFLEWAKRPENKKKICPEYDPEKIREAVQRGMYRVLGFWPTGPNGEKPETEDPAALI